MSISTNAQMYAQLEFPPSSADPPASAGPTPSADPPPTPTLAPVSIAGTISPAATVGSGEGHGGLGRPTVDDEGGSQPASPQPASPTASTTAQASLTPMRRGKVHGRDDTPSDRKAEAARWARAQADMAAKGKIVDDMRAGRFKVPTTRKTLAGGDAVKPSAIPVWGNGLMRLQNGRPRDDPFESLALRDERVKAAAQAAKTAKASREVESNPSKVTTAMLRRAQQQQAEQSAGPSSRPMHGAWQPLTQRQRDDDGNESTSTEDRNFPRLERRTLPPRTGPEPASRARARKESVARPVSPLERKSEEADARRSAEDANEAAARRIQEQLWSEEREYNRSHRTQSNVAADEDPMEQDDFEDSGDEAEIYAYDSDTAPARHGRRDSFDEISDFDSAGSNGEKEELLNIEPATSDDKTMAAARADIIAETEARIRWSAVTCEPIDGMTQAKLTAGIDPRQLGQVERDAVSPDYIYIIFVSAVGGTSSADLDRVTIANALDTMIRLCCRQGTRVLFSNARQDPNGPRLRPGTVIAETEDEELGALWEESAHWAMAGVRLTVQRYRRPHSASMVTIAGTRRNRQGVINGAKACARNNLPQLTNVFRQYNVEHPGKGRAARDNLIASITVRSMTMASRKALGFGTVQYNVYARLKELNPAADPRLLTGDDEQDGYPPLTDEQHRRIREAFQHLVIKDDRLDDGTPIEKPWSCDHCSSESHPTGKCPLKSLEGWFKTYEEFASAARKKANAAKVDVKGKGKAMPPPKGKSAGGGGGAKGKGGLPKGGARRQHGEE